MKCVNPRRLVNPAAVGLDDYYILVPCGKCYACLSNRRRSWLFRLKIEQMHSLMSFFCTFTYDDDFCDGFLHKKHLQDFFKRFRSRYKCTHYSIGEYGTTTFRPHYHSVVFVKCDSDGDVDFDFAKVRSFIISKWPFGFCSVSKCSYRRLNYVLHYHTRPKLVNGKKTFQTFSKGMGLDYLTDEIINFLVSSKSKTIIDLNGGRYVIPRYYRKKLVEQGYDIDGILPELTNYPVQRIEQVFGRKIYQISDFEIQNYLHSLVSNDKTKLFKYNSQDKFI